MLSPKDTGHGCSYLILNNKCICSLACYRWHRETSRQWGRKAVKEKSLKSPNTDKTSLVKCKREGKESTRLEDNEKEIKLPIKRGRPLDNKGEGQTKEVTTACLWQTGPKSNLQKCLGHWAGRGQEQGLGGGNLFAVSSKAVLRVVLGCWHGAEEQLERIKEILSYASTWSFSVRCQKIMPIIMLIKIRITHRNNAYWICYIELSFFCFSSVQF